MDDTNNAMLEYLLEMGQLTPEQEKAARMQKQAEMLRGQSMQAPQMRQAGRVSVAPNPLEVLAQMGTGYVARQKGQQADAAEAAMQKTRSDRLKQLRDRMYGGAAGGMGGYQDQPYGWEG
jgi:hypothetical protein